MFAEQISVWENKRASTKELNSKLKELSIVSFVAEHGKKKSSVTEHAVIKLLVTPCI